MAEAEAVGDASCGGGSAIGARIAFMGYWFLKRPKPTLMGADMV